MQVIAHRQELVFTNHGEFVPAKGTPGSRNYVPGHYEGGNGEHITVSPKPQIQTVPEWVRKTKTFAVAAKAGICVEVNAVPPPVVDGDDDEVQDDANAQAQPDPAATATPKTGKGRRVAGLS